MRHKRLAIGLGIGCGVIGVVCVVLAATALITGGAFMKWAMQTPEDVNIQVDTPPQTTKGESVVLKIQVENTAAESQSLHSIDISSEYLAGILMVNAEPPFTESQQIPFVDMQTYTFEQEIAPETTLVVQLFGTAIKAGDFSGQIDVCINSGSVCDTFHARTVVEE